MSAACARVFPGEHCETVTVGTLLGAQALGLSEAMLFGLSEGLGCFLAPDSVMAMPLFAGRVCPGRIAEKLAVALGVQLRCLPQREEESWEALLAELHAGRAVGVQLDCFFLEYFRSRVHFAGHFVAVLGVEGERVRLADTLSQGGDRCTTSVASFREAWAAQGALARPWHGFVLEGEPHFERSRVPRALAAMMQLHLSEGLPNLREAAEGLPGWLAGETGRADAQRAARLMERGGTGGANFRRLFVDFLEEASMDCPGSEAAWDGVLAHWRGLREAWHEFAKELEMFAETGDGQKQKEACALFERIAEAETQGASALLAVLAM